MKLQADLAATLAGVLEDLIGSLVPKHVSHSPSNTDVSAAEARSLLWLARHDNCLMSEFAKGVDVPLSTATRIIGRLVRKGLVVRKRPEDDRRVVRVALSKVGKNMERQTREFGIAAMLRMTSRLSVQQQETLIELLKLMSQA